MGNFRDGFVRVVGLRNGFVRVGQMGCGGFEEWVFGNFRDGCGGMLKSV